MPFARQDSVQDRRLEAVLVYRGGAALIHRQDRAQVDARRPQQVEPVLLRLGPGMLVWENDALLPFLETQPAEDHSPPPAPAVELELLIVDEHAGGGISAQGALPQPFAEE